MPDQKRGNREGDLVLVYHEENPAVYARIESIEPDIKRDWYQVTLLLLTLPAQAVTWILRREYIDGGGFTMGGQAMRMEGVNPVSVSKRPEGENSTPLTTDKSSRIIPFKKKS
ncbi:MAG: hypothetical protein MUO52_05755 [Desulfobacterales bacterium]|nr:hypothetical protein [Desulfobacterales bacterium]